MNVKNADLEKVAKINYPVNGPETDFIIEGDPKSGQPVVAKYKYLNMDFQELINSKACFGGLT